MALPEVALQKGDGVTTIDNDFNDEDMFCLHGVREWGDDLDLACADGAAAIAGKLDKGNFNRNIKRPHEISEKDKGAFEGAEQEWGSASVIMLNGDGKPLNGRVNLFLCNQNLPGVMVHELLGVTAVGAKLLLAPYGSRVLESRAMQRTFSWEHGPLGDV